MRVQGVLEEIRLINLSRRLNLARNCAALVWKLCCQGLLHFNFPSFSWIEPDYTSTCPSRPSWNSSDSAIREFDPFKWRRGVARTTSNNGGLPITLSRRSQPFRLYASINELQPTERRGRLFLRGSWNFERFSSILKFDTYAVSYFMVLARSEEWQRLLLWLHTY